MLRWVILDTKEEVDKLTRRINKVPGHGLSVEEVVSSLVACAMNDVSLPDEFLGYKFELCERLKHLEIFQSHEVFDAIGKFAKFLFAKIRELNLYSKHGVLWYEFAQLFHGSIVLKSIVTMEERL